MERSRQTYKSNVDWLGRIPVDWAVKPNRTLFEERKVRGYIDEELLSVTIGQGVIQQSALLKNSSKKDSSNEDKSKYKLVEVGDIAYNKMRMWQGAVGLSKYRGIVSPAYIVLRPRNGVNARYYHYLFRTPLYTTASYRQSYGIVDDQLSLRFEDFKTMYSPIPPRAEQDAIVAFLDEKLADIDRYIDAKRKLIDRLNELKAAIINQAVTKGLDADVPMKDSGIEWLGAVPAGWSVRRFGNYISKIEQGWSPPASNEEEDPNWWAVTTLSAVKKGEFITDAYKPLSKTLMPKCEYEVQKGNFLLTRSNTRNLVGDVCLVDDARPRILLCDLIYRLLLDEKSIDKEFVLYQLLSRFGRQQIEADARGSSHTMVKIAQSHIKTWLILAPPLDEQNKIVRFIKSEIGEVQNALTKIEDEIEYMQEFRTALVAEVVTGKIKPN